MELLKSLWSFLWTPATGIGAALAWLIGQGWRKYKGRMVTLRWTANYQSVAVASATQGFGNIQVMRDGIPVQNLSMVFVEIENESSQDLTDVEVNLRYDDGTHFFFSDAYVRDVPHELTLASRWLSTLQRFNLLAESERPNSSDLRYLATRRDYLVPVLNRGAKIDLRALVQAPAGIPRIILTCTHKGLRVREEPARPKLLGVDAKRSALLGIAVAVITALVLWIDFTPNVVVVWIAFGAGLFAQLFGVGILWLIRLTRKLLD